MIRAAAILTCLLVALPATAAADSARFAPRDVAATELADATNGTAMSAAGGHVVFSRETSPRTYELVDWSARGGLRTLPVGTRSRPFDADAGIDAQGHPLVAFSTCSARCSLRVLRLDRADAGPTRLRLRGDRGLSLTTPSMHGHQVVAVAAAPRGSKNVRILYWRTPGTAPRRLSGGTARCPSYERCTTGPVTAVDALDLGRRSVAFVWGVDPGGDGTGAGEELRTARLDGGHSRQAGRAQGYTSGACGYRSPGSPNALADGGVGFVVSQSPCDEDQTTIARWRAKAADFEGARPTGTLVGGAAWDGTRVYWLSCAPRHDPDYNADVISGACRLVVSSAVPFAPPTLTAHG